MTIDITIQELNEKEFERYGKVIDLPNTSAPKVGEGWECWSYLAMLDVSVPIGMGLVNTHEKI